MTKKYCDRCGKDTSGDQGRMFAPGEYAGTQHAIIMDSKRGIGSPLVLDGCKECRKKADALFVKFMQSGVHKDWPAK